MWPWPRPFRDNFSSADWDMLWLTYPPNLKFLPTPITVIWKALKCTQWGWFGVVRGHPRLSAMSPFDRAHTTSYLSNRNYSSILHHFLDKASYLSTFSNFDLPLLHLVPPLGVTPLEFWKDFWHQKTRVPGLSCGVVRVLLCLAILVEHRLVTDRQTEKILICHYLIMA